MADSRSAGHVSRVMNPWVLHLQKLGLELKCPFCLNLFSRPLLLPCDHLFCNACIVSSTKLGSECPLCKVPYANQDIRHVPFMENIVSIFRTLDATFHASLSDSIDSGVGKSGMKDKCRVQKDLLPKEFEMSRSRDRYTCATNPGLPMLSSQVRASQESGNGETCMNLVEQALMGSPPSFGDIKGSDNDSSDLSPKTHPAKRIFDVTRQAFRDGSASEIGGHFGEPKRQKKLNHRPLDMDVESPNHGQSILQTETLVTSNCKLETKSVVLPASEEMQANTAICGFCQSSRVSEVTGPMLHYVNGTGISVTGDEANRSNVIHVHSSCIEWAPQVYYAGESVKNLKAELARGSKLKCSRCGLKGAALGCYVKSCKRSYHVPCAKEIPKCRWDFDDFLLLCPSHSSVKFPSEKSRNSTSKDCAATQIAPSKSNFIWKQPDGKKEWVFCGSALSSEEKFLLVEFSSMIGASVTKFWSPDVTHVIAATDANGACTRTLKVLMAVSNGKWVLKTDWIKACKEAMQPVDEERYEISLDNHGCHDGPKAGRLRALNNEPKLFHGFDFYFVGDFVSAYKQDLINLVVAAGGTVSTVSEELLGCNTHDQAAALSNRVVVYNLDPPEGSELGEEVSIMWQRINEAQELATKIGGQVIGHTWLLESIAAYKLKPLGPSLVCS
ncbi:hypothetical protein SLA2020_162890 [Shorea laevis]